MIIEYNGVRVECLDTEEGASVALRALGYGRPAGLRKADLLELVRAAYYGERLRAIKAWRALTTDGLADSKDVIDTVIPAPPTKSDGLADSKDVIDTVIPAPPTKSAFGD